MTYYAQVTNGEITRINIALPFSTPQASIGSVTFPGEHDLYPITGSEPAYDPATQRLSGPTYQFTGDAVERVYTVTDIPAEELKAAFVESVVTATQSRLDTFARTRNYDGILSACTYASSSVPKFASEGQYCVNARDNTWATLYTIMGEVEAGTRPMPSSVDEVMSLLPELVWPAI